MDTNLPQDSKHLDKLLPLGVACTVVVLFFCFIFFLRYWSQSLGGFENVDKTGKVGDSFGALTSLFTGLAFGGVVVSLWLQGRQLQTMLEQMRQEFRFREQASKRDAADRVIAKWHNLLQSRNTIFRWVNEERDRGKPIPFFPDDITSEDRHRREVAQAIIDLMNFFEEWGSLAKAEALDRSYIHAILGFHAEWFFDSVFRELSIQVLQKRDQGQENQLVAPLAICGKYVFQYQKETSNGALIDEAHSTLSEILEKVQSKPSVKW